MERARFTSTPRLPGPRPRSRRRGVASMLAMLYLVLFAALAIGFYTATTTSAQISRNERHMSEAHFATESGMRFMRYQLAAMNLPQKTTADDLMQNVQSELARLLDRQPNVAGEPVRLWDSGIYIPGPTKWILVHDSPTQRRFRAKITQSDSFLLVTVIGVTRDTESGRAIQMRFRPTSKAGAVFGYGLASRSPIHMDSNAKIRGATDPSLGNVLSTSGQSPALLMRGNAQISGDVALSNPDPDSLSISSNSTIAGHDYRDEELKENVLFGAGEPQFPTIDTSAFERFATNVLSTPNKKYDSGILRNIRIKAGTNPTFDSNMKIEGVIYIETPNKVTFSSNTEVRGAIVVQNEPTGSPSTNTITFNSNVKLYSIDTLPANNHYPPEMRALVGSMILAPTFNVHFNSNFGGVGGHIIAEQLHFDSNARGTITGSVINLSDKAPVHMDSNADIVIAARGIPDPAGVTFGKNYTPVFDSYRELPVHSVR